MVRRSREEFQEWRNETVDVTVDNLIADTGKAIVVEVEGDTTYVGKTIIENLEGILEHLEIDPDERDTDITLQIPRWCAHENGWLDEEE